MEVGNEISQKIRSAIKAKLIELGAYVDDELPDYIMVMVANKKNHQQMKDDLSLFLSHNTENFTAWLQSLLKKLQSINTEPSASKHKSKEKHKGEKRKHKSQSDKASKAEVPEKKKKSSVSTEDSAAVSSAAGDTAQEEKKEVTVAPSSTGKAPAAAPVAVEVESTEINISENTDEFNEENGEVEKKPDSSKSSSTGKPPTKPPTKATKSKKSTAEAAHSSKSSSKRKSGEAATTEKHAQGETRKKPSSFVVAVKRKYEDLGEPEEEYDPTNPAVGSVASIVRGPTRKSSVPKSLQANKSLLMKAVSDAEKSVTTTKKTDLPEKQGSEPGMHSDRKPVDLSRRLKTAAGLQLISRSKRKEFEKMKYTVSNQGTAKETVGVKRSRSSSGGKEKMQFTVKNDSATSPSKASTRVQAPLAGSSRMAASAIKDISKQSAMVTAKVRKAASPDGNSSDQEDDDGRSSAYSSEDGDEMYESESELEEDGDDDEESEELESGSDEEVEIEVTDRAAQTVVNMKDKNFRSLVKSSHKLKDAEVQTDVVEIDIDDDLMYRLTKDKVEDMDRCLMHVFIDNSVSFDFVENEAFRMFAKALEPKYHFPKRKKLMTKIGMLYNQLKDNIKEDLSGAQFVTLTHSLWTSANSQRYDTINVHFLTKDWQLKSAVLKTVAVQGENLEEELAQHLGEIRVKWNLPEPTALTEDSKLEESVFEMLQWKRVTCFGSCIQEIVQKCLNCPEVSEFLQKGRDLIEELRKNPQALEVFEQKKKLLLPKELHSTKLVSDDRQNWSSTLKMMMTLTAQTPALHAAVMDSELMTQGVDFRSQLYNFIDQSTLESLCKIIKPFKTATEILTNNEVPTLQKILPFFVKLKKVLDEDQDDNSLIKSQKLQIKAQTDAFFSKNRDTCLMACFVHPQTKQMAFMSQEDKDHVKKLIFEHIKEQFESESNTRKREEAEENSVRKGKKSSQKQTKAMSEKAEETDTRHVVTRKDNEEGQGENNGDIKDSSEEECTNKEPSEDQDEPQEGASQGEEDSRKLVIKSPAREVKECKPASEAKVSDLSITVENDWLDDVICAAEEQKTPEELAKVELDLYMAELASSKNPLDWWREKQLVYPKISQLARQLLAVPASSLAMEDVFTFERHSELKSSKVKPEHIDTMVFLKKNWELYE